MSPPEVEGDAEMMDVSAFIELVRRSGHFNPWISIDEGSVIGAEVAKSVPKFSVAFGVPARIVKDKKVIAMTLSMW